jgi:hypothetical protein
MKFIRVAARAAIVVVIAGELFANGGTAFIRAGYPLDVGKSQALATCAKADPGFVRFSADQRNACCARLHIG